MTSTDPSSPASGSGRGGSDAASSFAIPAGDAPAQADPSSPAAAPPALYSVRGEFDGATVVLTGATGYVGSLVLEQLLRTTDVRRVYALMRGRRGASAADRLRDTLDGPLFVLLRGRPALLQKVVAVESDMDLPGLGLSPEDRAALTREAEVVIHCAADIRLEVDVQTTLRSNYDGTKKVLELAGDAFAGGAGPLRAHVHVSSAFVNMNRPRGSSVAERIYLMRHGAAADAGAAAAGAGAAASSWSSAAAAAAARVEEAVTDGPAATASTGPPHDAVDCEALVAELMDLEPAAAEARAESLCARWDYANNYAFGKNLAEQLVAARYRRGLLPPRGTCIVRPSLVAAVARAPHPGYVGNFAGPIGGVAAMITGLYGPLDGIASQPLGVWDIIPGDVVATAVVAAAAAASAGAAGTIARAAQAAREGRCDSVADALVEAAAAAAGASPASFDGASGSASPSPSSAAAATMVPRSLAAKLMSAASIGSASAAAADGAASGRSPFSAAAAASSSVSPDGSHPDSPGSPENSQQQQAPRGSLARFCSSTSLPPLASGRAPASRNNSSADLSPAARLAAAARAGSAALAPNGGSSNSSNSSSNSKLLIVHACTSSTYPVTLMENWNAAAEFITAHPPPFSLRGRRSVLPRMPPSFEPSLERVRRTDRRTGAKVDLLCALLRLAGDKRGAAKLSAGFGSIVVQNNGRTDRSLTFETHGLMALEAALCAEERPQRMLVWRPGPAPGDVLALSASYLEAGRGERGQATSAAAPVVAPSDLPPVSWRAFLLTQAAGVYGAMFRRAVDREADAGAELQRRQRQAWWRRPLGRAGAPETWASASSAKRAGGAWGAAASMGVVRHDFVLVKPLKA
jgi:hypothetical protein